MLDMKNMKMQRCDSENSAFLLLFILNTYNGEGNYQFEVFSWVAHLYNSLLRDTKK